jgi:hypothetical protein
MKLYPLLCLLCIIGISESCKNKTGTHTEDEEGIDTASNKAHYPVAGYIHSQILYLDSVPLAIMKYTTINNKVDTSITEKKDFAIVAEALSTPDISAPELKDQYEETSFIDATLGTISLTYSVKNDTAAIRKTDVLLKQDNTEVSTIYIEKKIAQTDSTILKKALWTAGRNLQVTTIIQYKNAPEKIIQEKYVWDDRP